MLKAYKPIPLIIFLVLSFYVLIMICSEAVLARLDAKNYQQFLKGDVFYTPFQHGLPWEINVVYNEVFNLAPHKNLVFLGSSTAREGVIPELLRLPDGWKLLNLSIGADTIDSFRMMLNYLNSQSNHRLDSQDVAVVHIWYVNFVKRPLEADYFKKIMELFGFCSVGDNLQVNCNIPTLQKKWKLLNFKIRLGVSALIFKRANAIFGPNVETLLDLASAFGRQKLKPIKNNLIKEYQDAWMNYTRDTRLPSDTTEEFKKFLEDLKSQTNVAVVNLYIPSWHRNNPVEAQYEEWLHSDLAPFLKERKIPLLDFSQEIPDWEYGDSAHLFKRGREIYTRLFNGQILNILNSVDKNN